MSLPNNQIALLLTWAIVALTLPVAQSVLAQEPSTPFADIVGASRVDKSSADFSARASIYGDIPQFGGPSSVGGQLAEDAAITPQFRCQRLQDHFEPWYDFKERLNQSCGLQFNIDESIFYQAVSESTGENDAASGIARVFGQWEFLGRGTENPGMLVFKAEDRHRIDSPLTPFDLGFEAGSVVPTGTFFSEFGFSVTNLYWKQYLFDRQLALAAGRIDVTDFIDVYAMMNPLTHFINLAFSTNPTIAAPNQGLGVAAGGMLTEHLYMQGGFSDANGQPTHAGIDTFFNESEYFSYVEFGATTSQDRLFADNIHVTLWHTDARKSAQTPRGQGVAFSAAKFVDDRWLPFFRFGYSDGDAALMQTTFSTGLGLQRKNRDVIGVGISWGSPANGKLRDQFTSELFYRFQLTQFLAVTPDVQLIVDPALNPTVDMLAFFGIRLRAAF